MVGRKLPQGELEHQVLEVLWDHGEPMTPAEVRGHLTTGRPLAYTTVMTILVRLWEKGQLDRQRVGRAYAYRPRSTREEHIAARMSALLDATGDRSVALARFVETLSPEQLEELRHAIGSDE